MGTKVDAWTLGGSYRTGGLYFNLGYAQNKRKDVKGATDIAVLTSMWQGTAGVYAAANGAFSAGDANKREMFKIGVGYQITPQVNAGVHYFHAKQSGSASGAYNGKADFVVAVVDYAFSKRTDAYFGVDHTKVSGGSKMFVDGNGATKRTGITVGLRHRF